MSYLDFQKTKKKERNTKISKKWKIALTLTLSSWNKKNNLYAEFFGNLVTDLSLINPKFLAELLSKTYPKSANRTRIGHHVRLDGHFFCQKWPFLAYFAKKCPFKKSNNSADFLSVPSVPPLYRSPKFISELFEIRWYKSIKNGANWKSYANYI